MADGVAALPAAEITQETAPATVSAEVAASEKDDFSAFEQAHTAKRQGKPLAAVPAPEKAESTEPRQLSNRQKAINDAAQKAADTATATLQEENRRLKDELAQRTLTREPARTEPVAQPVVESPVKGDPAYKRYMAMPDAPKLDDFESVADHNFAAALFVAQKLNEEQSQQAQQRDAYVGAAKQRVDTFVGRLNEAKKADPEFVTKLSDEVKALHPEATALAQGEPLHPRHFVGDLVYDSEVAPAVLLHFSEHPDALTALETMPERIKAIPFAPGVPLLQQPRILAHKHYMAHEFAKLEGRLESASGSARAPIESASDRHVAVDPPSPISKAPPPPPTLSRPGRTTDPMESALKRDDITAFMALELEKKRARRSA